MCCQGENKPRGTGETAALLLLQDKEQGHAMLDQHRHAKTS